MGIQVKLAWTKKPIEQHKTSTAEICLQKDKGLPKDVPQKALREDMIGDSRNPFRSPCLVQIPK